MLSCCMETSLNKKKKKKCLKLLKVNVIHDYFCGSGAQIEKLIVCLFSSRVSLRLLANASYFWMFKSKFVSYVPTSLWYSWLYELAVTASFCDPGEEREKEVLLLIYFKKKKKVTVWWPEVLSLFSDNCHHYSLFHCIAQFVFSVYFFWLCKSI